MRVGNKSPRKPAVAPSGRAFRYFLSHEADFRRKSAGQSVNCFITREGATADQLGDLLPTDACSF